MSIKNMALYYITLLTVLPWTGVPVRMKLTASQLEVEIKDKSQQNRTLLLEPSEESLGEMVYANVYDLDDSNEIAVANTVLFAGGIYHVGIEAFGEEVQYGGGPTEKTGVTRHDHPRKHSAHKYYWSYEMGRTRLNKEEFFDLVDELAKLPKWKENNYDVLKNNCIVFADDLLKALPEAYSLPDWMTRLMRIGQWTLPKLAPLFGVLSRSPASVAASKAASNASKAASKSLSKEKEPTIMKVHNVCSTQYGGVCGEFQFELLYHVSCPLGLCCHKFKQFKNPMCLDICPGTDRLYSQNANGACTASNHSESISL